MRNCLRNRRYTSGVLAALSLTAVVSASACTPVAAVSHASSARVISSPMPSYAPYATHVAIKHVVAAPSIYAYPWATDRSGGNDVYGLTMRQCVSYVAWYLNAHGTPFGYFTQGPSGVGTFANATVWDTAARKAGFKVSTTPVVGSVAQWHAYERSSWTTANGWGAMTSGSAGHVAIVTRVYPNGNVDLAQYNMGDNRAFSTTANIRAPRYIYVPLSSPNVS